MICEVHEIFFRDKHNFTLDDPLKRCVFCVNQKFQDDNHLKILF